MHGKITSRTFYQGPPPAIQQAKASFDRAARLAKHFEMHLELCSQCRAMEDHPLPILDYCKGGNDLRMELARAITAGWYALKEEEKGRGQLTKTDFEELVAPRMKAEIRRLYRADHHYKSVGEVLQRKPRDDSESVSNNREPWKTNPRHFK